MKTKTILKEGALSLVPGIIMLNIDRFARNTFDAGVSTPTNAVERVMDHVARTGYRAFMGLYSSFAEMLPCAIGAQAVSDYSQDNNAGKALTNGAIALAARFAMYGWSKMCNSIETRQESNLESLAIN